MRELYDYQIVVTRLSYVRRKMSDLVVPKLLAQQRPSIDSLFVVQIVYSVSS